MRGQEAEIDKIVLPMVNGYEEANRYKSILFVLLDDEQTMAVLRDFGERYYDATHPLELTEMGAESATDIVMTILLAIVTAGAGGVANLAAKAPKLAKVIELLERLSKMLKGANPFRGNWHHLKSSIFSALLKIGLDS